MYYKNLKINPLSKLAFIDIDNTLTGNGPGTGNPQSIMKVRGLLKKNQYLYCPNTSRTEEMMMSQKTYELSKELYSFKRPEPKLLFVQGIYCYKDPILYEPKGILDGEIIISSSGSKIFVKQDSGAYQEDLCFYNKAFPNPQVWRKTITTQINNINNQKNIAKLSYVEDVSLYVNGTNNVYPLDYRIQLFFDSIEDKLFFISELMKIKKVSNDISIVTLHIADDSNPNKNKISVYLTPKNSKVEAIDHVIKHFKKDLNLIDPELIIIGDSWLDLEMGLFSAPNIPKTTFYLVGGSRLTEFVIDSQKNSFAGESLTKIRQNLIKTNGIGIYYYKDEDYERKVVIGDMVYPGKVGSDSIIEFLS